MSVISDTIKKYFQRHKIPSNMPIGVAVSGGSDSLCLAYHLANFCKKNNIVLKAITINHQLRPESQQEADFVHTEMKKINIKHDTLQWEGKKPTSRLEEKARIKRYELIYEWCLKNQITHLFLAHHMGDQAETFWARLARGSGVDGLSGMGEKTPYRDIILCRPFLGLEKNLLLQELKNKKKHWFEDSMNYDETYERVRWRKSQKKLSEYGLTPQNIYRSTYRLQRVKEALSFYTERFFDSLVDISPKGYAFIQEQAFFSIPFEIRMRVLIKVINIIYPKNTPLSMESLEKWLENMPLKSTFGGCVLTRYKGGIFISREASKMEKETEIQPNTITHWDRFWIFPRFPTHIKAGIQDKELPLAVRQSIPCISDNKKNNIIFMRGHKKELEKISTLDYKETKSNFVYILFEEKL